MKPPTYDALLANAMALLPNCSKQTEDLYQPRVSRVSGCADDEELSLEKVENRKTYLPLLPTTIMPQSKITIKARFPPNTKYYKLTEINHAASSFTSVRGALSLTHSRTPPSVFVGYHESSPIIIDNDHSWRGYLGQFVVEPHGNHVLTLQLFDSLKEAEAYIDELELQS